MSRHRLAGMVASASLLLALFVVLPGIGADEKSKASHESLYRPLGLFTEVLSLVKGNYVEEVDAKPLLYGAFSGMADAMDAFAEYVPPEKMAAFAKYEAGRSKELPELGLVLARRMNYPVVVAAVGGSPAAAAGVKSDDLIEKIDDQPARGLALWEVEARLAGPAGGRVRLLVVRDGKPRRRTLDVVRGSWAPAAPSASRAGSETVVKIPSFGPGTAAAVRAILAPLDRTRPLVVDLRDNAWGSYDEAARTAALFAPAGSLGELTGRKIETKSFRAEPGERVHESRLVLIMDSGTAGPAELFAAGVSETLNRPAVSKAEKKPKAEAAPAEEEFPDETAPAPVAAWDGRMVRLVGEPSVGMGFVQQTLRLQSGGSLKLSVGKIRTPSGRSLSPKGLTPDDRVFHVPLDETAPGAPPDPFLDRALKVLSESRPKAAA
ncbi:MAG TPA: S41 family peptidase [Thermoanaerobaculia bacterium]|nr:S41 family peptidase [Thermoanaerobaculia bacterium]